MPRYLRACLVLIVAAWAAPAPGEEIPAPLVAEFIGRVVEIVDGDTLILEDARRVRLVGLQAPKLPLGRPGFEPWPPAEEAKAALAELTLGKEVTLAYGGRRMDRHGRHLAHLFLEDGTWVQETLLKGGMARVHTFADNRAVVERLLEAEREARAGERGIWSHRDYRIRTPEDTKKDIGTFQIVEGAVHNVNVVRGRGFLNFTEDWREDFTVTLAPRVRRLFESEGYDVENYEGRVIRVRGWIDSFNGPQIQVTHPEQIEVAP